MTDLHFSVLVISPPEGFGAGVPLDDEPQPMVERVYPQLIQGKGKSRIPQH